MGIEHLVDNYSAAGDMVSFLCCVTLLVVIKLVLFFSKDKKFVYLKRSVHFIMLGSLANISFSCVVKYYPTMDIAIFALRTFYHFCFMSCLYLYILYLKKMLDISGKLVTRVSYFTRALFLVVLAFEILSPVTKFGLYKEGDLWYDAIYNAYNVFYVYGVLLLLVMIVMYSNRMIRSVRSCLIATEFIVLCVMAMSGYRNINTLTSFTYVMPVIVMMILLHSKPFDDRTGSLGMDSFESFIAQAVKKKTSFDYMVLKLNTNGTNKIPKELGKIINSFWHSSFNDAELFKLESELFLLAIPRTSKNGNTEEKIKNLFDNDFKKHYSNFQLGYKVIGLFDIDFIQNDADISNIIHYLLITMDENTMLIADDKLREQLKLLRDIMDNLIDISEKNDLNDPRVLTYCQPIRNMKTGEFDTAEALMRLTIPEKGFIMPFLFIPLAEYYGYIHALSRIMLNKVCLEIKELEKEGYSFSRISVNFAASEIRSEEFCDEILGIIRNAGVDPSKIGIEITESQNEGDFVIVKERMKTLRNAGMTLYLDDVGTGYSNLDRIVKYDVDVVKFDRFFLMESEKEPKVGNMMRHLAQAFKDLNYALLYEGVETDANEELCMSCGAEYIQGFKYSKPLPIEQMREFFVKKAI